MSFYRPNLGRSVAALFNYDQVIFNVSRQKIFLNLARASHHKEFFGAFHCYSTDSNLTSFKNHEKASIFSLNYYIKYVFHNVVDFYCFRS